MLKKPITGSAGFIHVPQRGTGFTHVPQRGTGFTLIEMLVVIFIFTTMLSLVLVNFRRGERLEEFRLATSRVASVLKQAQTQALTGIGTQGSMDQGYGVYFDLATPGQYIIFENNSNKQDYEPVIDEIIETILLPDGILISNLSSESYTGGPITIFFQPPKPRYFINDGFSNDSNEAEIRLSHDRFPDKVGVISLKRVTGRITSELKTP